MNALKDKVSWMGESGYRLGSKCAPSPCKHSDPRWESPLWYFVWAQTWVNGTTWSGYQVRLQRKQRVNFSTGCCAFRDAELCEVSKMRWTHCFGFCFVAKLQTCLLGKSTPKEMPLYPALPAGCRLQREKEQKREANHFLPLMYVAALCGLRCSGELIWNRFD